MFKNMLRNQAFLRDSLKVISDWRLLTFCSVILLRNTVLMFLQKNLQTCFDVACSRRSDRTRSSIAAQFSLTMTVPFPIYTLLCSNQMNKREYI